MPKAKDFYQITVKSLKNSGYRPRQRHIHSRDELISQMAKKATEGYYIEKVRFNRKPLLADEEAAARTDSKILAFVMANAPKIDVAASTSLILKRIARIRFS